MIRSTSSTVLADRASAAMFCRFWPTMSEGKRTSWRKLCATHCTMITNPASPIRPIVGEMTCASTNAAGSPSRDMTQKSQKHVMVPTLLVISTARRLLKRA